MLERVKAASDKRFAMAEDKSTERILEIIKKKSPQATRGVDDTAVRMDIKAAFKQIRAMHDVDFQIKKESIAQELRSKVIPEKPKPPRKERIKSLLLSENIIGIMDERLRKLDANAPAVNP